MLSTKHWTANLSCPSDFSISFCPLSVSGSGLPSTYAAILITVLLAGVITTTLAFIGLPFSGMTAYVISYTSFACQTLFLPHYTRSKGFEPINSIFSKSWCGFNQIRMLDKVNSFLSSVLIFFTPLSRLLRKGSILY